MKTLLEARLAVGFNTQRELADAAGVHKTMVWMGENPGYQRPLGRKSAYKILKALNDRGANVGIEDLDWKISGK